MMITLMVAVLMLWAGADSSGLQAVPEGTHRDADGPVEMCGLKAEDVPALRVAAVASTQLRSVPIESDRFELFASPDQNFQLLFTLPAEAAYPAATCRHVYEQDGYLRMSRSMRCEVGRAECDALFLEVQALDSQLTSALRNQ